MTLGVVATGCVDPVGDFEDYKVMAQARPKPTLLLCPSAPPDPIELSGSFVGYCKVNFAPAEQALLLSTQFQLQDGKLSATLTPLLTTAQALSDTAGDPPVNAESALTSNKFAMNFGLVRISGAANAISGSEIELDGALFKGVVVSQDKILAELDGKLIKPFAYDLNVPQDICIFLRSPDGVTMPARPDPKDFDCLLQ
ncbi:MAG: hypothetical protein MUF64_19205 [Polyangiaceae bacterium]|jgi:hypothetical protein|nr:hypothetical protein [Polyangiaceae bacterium]